MISIGKGCGQLGTVLHEMMHMLGFRHEQVRPDRDEYLKMYWENMSDGKEIVTFYLLLKNKSTIGFQTLMLNWFKYPLKNLLFF